MADTAKEGEVLDLNDLRREMEEKKKKRDEQRIAMKKKYNRTYKDRHPERLQEWNKRTYEKHKEKIKPQRRARRNKLKAELIALKGGKCMECEGIFPAYAYDFHHVNGRDMVIGNLMSLGSVAMLEELNKCELLCAICHRGKHVKDEDDGE